MWTLLFGDRENSGDPADDATTIQDLIDIVDARLDRNQENRFDEGPAATVGGSLFGGLLGGIIAGSLAEAADIERGGRINAALEAQANALRNLEDAIKSEDIGAIGQAIDNLWDQGVPPNIEEEARRIGLEEANRIAEQRYQETGILGDGAFGDNVLGDGVAYDYTLDISNPTPNGENVDDRGRPTSSPRPVARPDDLVTHQDNTANPIILDLDGDGIEISVFGDAQFDLDGDGFQEAGHWVGPDDGFLVLDLGADGSFGAADGTIDRAEELIWSLWGEEGQTDLEALAHAFDDDNNGVINSDDAIWSDLRIWQDLNSDGVSDDGEVRTLADWGITQINVSYDNGTGYDDITDDLELLGSTLHGTASFVHNGTQITLPVDAVADENGLYTATGGVGDVSLHHNALGYRVYETDLGYSIEFETGEHLHYAQLVETSNANLNLTDAALDGATGNGDNNTLDARGHSRAVYVSGGDGNDSVFGGYNDDYLSGDAGADVLDGGDGNDFIFADFQDFSQGSVTGGNGFDTLYVVDTSRPEDAPADYAPAGVTVTLAAADLEAAYGGDGDDWFSAQGQVAGTVGLTDDVSLFGGGGNDVLLGGVASDVLSGDGGNDEVYGWHGDDAVFGGEGNDTLHGQNGDDILLGGDGDDELRGGNGDDRLLGDDGDDYLNGADGDDTIDAGGGNDQIHTGNGDNLVRAGEGADTVFASGFGDNVIFGGEGDDVIHNAAGDDVFHGDEGDDVFYHAGFADYDVYFGGDGHDVLHLVGNRSQYIIEWTWASGYNQIQVTSVALGIVIDTRGIELFVFEDGTEMQHVSAGYGDQGAEHYVERETSSHHSNMWSGWQDNNYVHATNLSDYRYTGSGDDIVIALGGNDWIQAGQGNDTIVGGDGADNLDGQNGSDAIDGGTGNDTIEGLSGSDTIWGGHGNDRVEGGSGGDYISGGEGNDSIHGQSGGDFIWGDAGNDTINGDDGADNLNGGEGNDSLRGGTGDDYILGGAGNDHLDGGYGADRLVGGEGQDTLLGASGHDQLFGNEADDSLDGGQGFDLLAGGAGGDTLVGGDGDDYLIGNSFRTAEAATYVPPQIGDDEGEQLYGAFNSGQTSSVLYIANVSGTALERVEDISTQSSALSDYHALLYLASYSDLQAVDANSGRWHFETHGRAEGRQITFDAMSYLAANDYLIAAVGFNLMEAVTHYLHLGQHQAALGNTSHNLAFDPEQYLRNYAEVRELYLNDYFAATIHYIQHGYAQGHIWQEATADALSEQGFRSFLLNQDDGADALYGGEGRDFLAGGAGADTIDGGAGALDTASYATSDAAVTINLHAGTNSGGHAEGDVISGIENLLGSEYNDHLTGTDQDNTLEGVEGNDTVHGLGGHDEIYGGDGDDVIHAGSGNDRVWGGLGGDVVHLNSGDDTFFGESGVVEDDEGNIVTPDGATVYGGYGNDQIIGDAGNDSLYGHADNDTIDGGDGGDIIYGGGGFDVLNGGNGNDLITGGGNWDVFVFDGDFGNDRITDFNVANAYEHIDLSGVGAITAFADLLANHADQVGADTVINDGLGNTITLSGVSLSALTADDFVF